MKVPPLSIQLLPFYHGSDHNFNEGDNVFKGWTTRSRIVASMYGRNVYEVQPDDSLDPGYGGHTILKKVEPDYRDELENTESLGKWEVDKDDVRWDDVRRARIKFSRRR